MDMPFYFILLLHSLPPPGLLHTTVCVLLRGWSEGSCPQVLLHTCDSGKEIPEPLLLMLPHLTASQSLEGLLCICSKVPLNPPPSLSIWLVADLFGIP